MWTTIVYVIQVLARSVESIPISVLKVGFYNSMNSPSLKGFSFRGYPNGNEYRNLRIHRW